MNAPAMTPAKDRHADYNKTRLYFVSCLALTMAGINFSMRSNTAEALQKVFLDPIDPIHAATQQTRAIPRPHKSRQREST